MKKLFTLLLVATLFVACDDKKKSDNEGHAAMIEASKNGALKTNNEPAVIGSAFMDNGTINPIIGGDLNTEKVWLTYIQAHNDRDLDKITAINTTDWEAYLPDGRVLKGPDAQTELLKTWFKTSNPKWKVQWMITNNSNNEEGVMTQWLTTGNDLTDTDEEGNETVQHQVHDIKFVDGKIKRINIYDRLKTIE